MNFKNYSSLVDSLVIISCVSISTFFGIFGNPFFRDFPIIFDGAYRISIGIFPFLDFSLFPIPIPFFIQALFNVFFGPNLVAMAINTIVLSSIVSIIFYFIVRKHFSRLFSIFLAAAFHYSFIGIIAFPWYNQISLFFFLLNFFLLYFDLDSRIEKKKLFLISILLTIFSIFSKLEIGAMHFVLILGYFLITEKNKKKVLTSYALPFVVIYWLINKSIQFISFWGFDMGASKWAGKIHQIFSIFTLDLLIFSFTTYFLLFLFYFFLINFRKFKNLNPETKKIFYLILILNLITLGTTIFSGLPVQTKIFALPLNLFLVFLFVKKTLDAGGYIISKKTLKLICVFLIFTLIFTQFNGIANYQYEFFKSPTRQAYNIFFLGNTKYERETFGCYAGTFYEKQHFDDLNKIREYIKKYNQDFVVFGEYQFLYCDYKTSPPEKLPLWLHESITFDKDKNFDEIKKYFIENKPLLVIEQLYAPNNTREEFGAFLEGAGYQKIDVVSSELEPINLYTIN